MRFRVLLVLLIATGCVSAQSLTTAIPGQTVPITTTGLNSTDTITVTLTPQEATKTDGCSNEKATITLSGPASGGFSLGIPPTLCPGLYNLTGIRQAASEPGKEAKPPDT